MPLLYKVLALHLSDQELTLVVRTSTALHLPPLRS